MSKKLRKKKSNLLVGSLHLLVVLLVVAGGYFAWMRGKDKGFDLRKYLSIQEYVKISGDSLKQEDLGYVGVKGEMAKALVKLNLKMGKNFSFGRDVDGSVLLKVRVQQSQLDLTYMTLVLKKALRAAGSSIIEASVLLEGKENQIIARATDGEIYTVSIGYLAEDEQAVASPKLAVIVDDFGGYQGELLANFCKADRRIAFAVLPNLPLAKTVMNAAVISGHEVLVHIPMEPLSYPRNTPGENAIMVDLSDAEIAKRVESYLEILPKAVGANNHMGSRATQDQRVMSAVLDVLKKAGLFFVDSRTIATSVAYQLGKEKLIPVAKRDMFLDVPTSSRQVVMTKVNTLAKWKSSRKQVVVISHCFDQDRLDNLLFFLEEAKKLGYEIVPVSKLFAYDNKY